VKDPLQGLLALVSQPEFRPLLQPGTKFRAEALLGSMGQQVWLNVSHLLVLDPDVPVGVRQVLGEPECPRRIWLAARGVRAPRVPRGDEGMGAFVVGDLVHAAFQGIFTDRDRDAMLRRLREHPERLLAGLMPPLTGLMGAFGMLGETRRLRGGEGATALRHVMNLVDSPRVMSLVGHGEWQCEVPVRGRAIDGKVDLRSSDTLLELKTDAVGRWEHTAQLQLYLIGEMMELGVEHVLRHSKGYLIRSSANIGEDRRRAEAIEPSEEILSRFVSSRHRYLLACRRLKLPRVQYPPSACQRCPYAEGMEAHGQSPACDFYCQAERSWGCTGCPHQEVCDQSQVLHPYEVLDEAGRIRMALLEEIEDLHQAVALGSDLQPRPRSFAVSAVGPDGVVVLAPASCTGADPPQPGESVTLFPGDWSLPVGAEVVRVGPGTGECVVAPAGMLPRFTPGMPCQMVLPLGDMGVVHRQLSCVDRLQRSYAGSSREGVAFAGGRVVSGRLEQMEDLPAALASGATDVFCQSFSAQESAALLSEALARSAGTICIVAEDSALTEGIPEVLPLTLDWVRRTCSSAPDVDAALCLLAERLRSAKVWVAPQSLVQSDVLTALPNHGLGYFDDMVFYETDRLTALDYYLLRRYARRRICIGDANAVGRRTRGALSREMGLGENVLHRALTRGFPSSPDSVPVVVLRSGQGVLPDILAGLGSCRMEVPLNPRPSGELRFVTHTGPAALPQASSRQYELTVAVPGGRPSEVSLRAENEYPRREVEQDIAGLRLGVSLVHGAILPSPVSGNMYRVVEPPRPLAGMGGRRTAGEWVVQVEVPFSQLDSLHNEEEAGIVVGAARRAAGTTAGAPVAILSPFSGQLDRIAHLLGQEAMGFAFRTPHGIGSARWHTVIVSCVATTLAGVPAEIADPRLFYTMLRAARASVTVVGHEGFLRNHPLFRSVPSLSVL
jgi:hypothetical protein